MALACKEAQVHYDSLGEYPSTVQENEMKKRFTDGDFAVKYERDLGFVMYDAGKIPEINKETHNKTLEFARNKNLEVVQTEYGCYTDLRKKEDWKERAKDFFKSLRHGQSKILKRKAIIRVGNHFFAAKNSQLFEEFGNYVFDLKTESEKK